MNAKTSTKNKRRPVAQESSGTLPTKKIERDWHGVKVGTKKSAYDLKLLKLLVGDPSQIAAESPLGWLLNPLDSTERLGQVRRWHRILSKQAGSEPGAKVTRLAAEIFETIDSIELDCENPGDALVVLAACHAIRGLAGNCEFEDWIALVSRILQISKVAESGVQLAPTVYQWLAIEVPLTIAFQIPEIENNRKMGEQSCHHLAIAISEMLDTDGGPSSKYLPEFGPLVASWVRSTLIAEKIGLDLIHESASQLEWMVPQLLRMLRPDGTLVFSSCHSAPINDQFLNALFRLSHDPADKPLKRILGSNAKRHRIRIAFRRQATFPSGQNRLSCKVNGDASHRPSWSIFPVSVAGWSFPATSA